MNVRGAGTLKALILLSFTIVVLRTRVVVEQISQRKAVLVFAAAAVIAAGLLLFAIGQSGNPARIDFVAFYAAGKIVLHGNGPHLYDLGTQIRTEKQYTPYPALYPHAPAEALLFAPFALFGYRTALLLWRCLEILALAAAIFLLREQFKKLSTGDLLLVSAVLFLPIFAALRQGQDSFLELLVFALCYRLLDSGRNFAAALALAVGLAKPELALPSALIVGIRRGPKFLAGFLAGAAAFVGMCVVAVGPRAVIGYPAVLWEVGRATALARYVPYPNIMPNLRGLAYVAFSTCCEHRPLLDLAVILISGLLFLAAVTWAWRFAPIGASKDTGFAAAVLVALLVSWHLLIHDLSLLLLPLVILLSSSRSKLLRGTAVLVLVGELAAFASHPQHFSWSAIGLLSMLAFCLLGSARTRVGTPIASRTETRGAVL